MPKGMPHQRLHKFQNDTFTLQAAYQPELNSLATQSQGLDEHFNTVFARLAVEISTYQQIFHILHVNLLFRIA